MTGEGGGAPAGVEQPPSAGHHEAVGVAATDVVVGRVGLLGEGLEVDGSVGVVVTEGGAGRLAAAGAGTRSGHAWTVPADAPRDADRYR